MARRGKKSNAEEFIDIVAILPWWAGLGLATMQGLTAAQTSRPVGIRPRRRNISPTDPGARWTAVRGGPAFYAYSTNYLIDLEAGIIVDVEATPAHRTEEVDATRTMPFGMAVSSRPESPSCVLSDLLRPGVSRRSPELYVNGR
jgi:hypothetical protein